jgi:hypothetical protein
VPYRHDLHHQAASTIVVEGLRDVGHTHPKQDAWFAHSLKTAKSRTPQSYISEKVYVTVKSGKLIRKLHKLKWVQVHRLITIPQTISNFRFFLIIHKPYSPFPFSIFVFSICVQNIFQYVIVKYQSRCTLYYIHKYQC